DGQLAVLAHQLVTLAEILAAIGVTGDRVLPDVRRLGRRGAGGWPGGALRAGGGAVPRRTPGRAVQRCRGDGARSLYQRRVP
ncbi:hypothetical protein CJT61_30875, partial [Pseudomonas aeruginosa]